MSYNVWPPGSPDECSWVRHYGLYGDTVLGTQNYSRLMGINHFPNWPYYIDVPRFILDSSDYVGGIRADSLGKVFFHPRDSSREFLIYDFSLNVGDTFCFVYPDSFGCVPVGYVDSVSGPRRRITFSWPSNIWLEGIGSEYGWFEYDIVATSVTDLACFRTNQDTLVFNNGSFPGSCSCLPAFLARAQSQHPPGILIYPNPVMDRCILEFPDAGKGTFELIKPDGTRILTGDFVPDEKISLNLEDLNAGFYLIRVVSEKGNSIHNFVKF